jgi:hypothetical protein
MLFGVFTVGATSVCSEPIAFVCSHECQLVSRSLVTHPECAAVYVDITDMFAAVACA